MKRLLLTVSVVCLVATSCGANRSSEDVLADEENTDAVPETTVFTPPTTGNDSDVALEATVDGKKITITHGDMNKILEPTYANDEFVSKASQVGLPLETINVDLLGALFIEELYDNELEKNDLKVVEANSEEATEFFEGIVGQWYTAEADPQAEARELIASVPYLSAAVEAQAKSEALNASYEDVEEPLEQVCLTEIVVADKSAADDVFKQISEGGDANEIAAAESQPIPRLGPNGLIQGPVGEQDCQDTTELVSTALIQAVEQNKAAGGLIDPVQSEYGWHVLNIDSVKKSDSFCSRHILAGVEVTEETPEDEKEQAFAEAEEDIMAIKDELDAGADFAELAIEKSTGPSGPEGGSLGCGDPAGFVPEFAAALNAAAFDEPTEPVRTDFGWHVILKEEGLKTPEYLSRQALNEILASADVEVDPKIGTWNEFLLQIVPPESATATAEPGAAQPPTASPDGSADTPGAAEEPESE